MKNIILRSYCPADLDTIERLFYETVHTVNAADYSPEQLDAWAPGQIDRPRSPRLSAVRRRLRNLRRIGKSRPVARPDSRDDACLRHRPPVF